MEEKKLSKYDVKKESLKKLEEVEKAYLDLMEAYSSCLAPLHLKKHYVDASGLKAIYSFSWDNVPGNGNDREILRRFLKDYLHIGWAENAEIRKSNDGKIISISKDENRSKIILDETKEKATLKISDGITHNLKVKKKHGKRKINPQIKHGAWLDLEKGFYIERCLDLQKQEDSYMNIELYKRGSPIKNFIAYRIVRWRIRKRLDRLRDKFLLLIIAQNRNKIDSEVIKRFEIYSEDMDKLSAQFAKYNIYATITGVAGFLTSFLSVFKSFLSVFNGFVMPKFISDVIIIIINIGLILSIPIFLVLLIFIIIGIYLNSRVFSETAVPEKEKKLLNRIQEYLEFE